MTTWPICTTVKPWYGEPMKAVHPTVKTLEVRRLDPRSKVILARVECQNCRAQMWFSGRIEDP